ncbi:MAG: glycosyltransferase family protein, partial [Acidimicrobiales bacterium]
RVELTGWVSDADYVGWVERASLAVQLRASTNGETSGAVAECLAAGLATVVSDQGPAHELPDCVAKLPSAGGPEQLAALLASLLGSPRRREEMGEQSQDFVGRHGFAESAQSLLELALRRWAAGR